MFTNECYSYRLIDMIFHTFGVNDKQVITCNSRAIWHIFFVPNLTPYCARTHAITSTYITEYGLIFPFTEKVNSAYGDAYLVFSYLSFVTAIETLTRHLCVH